MSASHTFVQDDAPEWGPYLSRAITPFKRGDFDLEECVTVQPDDALLRFVLDVRPAFDVLRDAIAQTAAVLVLAASGSRGAAAHPMLPVARAHANDVRQQLAVLRHVAAAQHGRRHLCLAEDYLRAALDNIAANLRRLDASRRRSDVDHAYELLCASQKHLKFAAAALPGLEVVTASESCACHALVNLAE